MKKILNLFLCLLIALGVGNSLKVESNAYIDFCMELIIGHDTYRDLANETLPFGGVYDASTNTVTFFEEVILGTESNPESYYDGSLDHPSIQVYGSLNLVFKENVSIYNPINNAIGVPIGSSNIVFEKDVALRTGSTAILVGGYANPSSITFNGDSKIEHYTGMFNDIGASIISVSQALTLNVNDELFINSADTAGILSFDDVTLNVNGYATIYSDKDGIVVTNGDNVSINNTAGRVVISSSDGHSITSSYFNGNTNLPSDYSFNVSLTGGEILLNSPKGLCSVNGKIEITDSTVMSNSESSGEDYSVQLLSSVLKIRNSNVSFNSEYGGLLTSGTSSLDMSNDSSLELSSKFDSVLKGDSTFFQSLKDTLSALSDSNSYDGSNKQEIPDLTEFEVDGVKYLLLKTKDPVDDPNPIEDTEKEEEDKKEKEVVKTFDNTNTTLMFITLGLSLFTIISLNKKQYN